jgi:predicted metal-dependent hydrolase
MKYTIIINNQQLPIVVKKHLTSKRVILRYKPLKNCVSLTLPRYVSVKQGLNFAQSKIEWLAQQITKFSNANDNFFVDGAIIPVLGENLTIKYIGGRGTISKDCNLLQVHGGVEFLERRVRAWLHNKCKAEIATYVEKFCQELGVKAGRITLRDTSSRWGSCSANGNLSFSWRLIFAPRNVLEYVVAHEVAHICEHNHSPAFWAVVSKICPNWKSERAWLKTHGKLLHKF